VLSFTCLCVNNLGSCVFYHVPVREVSGWLCLFHVPVREVSGKSCFFHMPVREVSG
jgi:hypothetical protein